MTSYRFREMPNRPSRPYGQPYAGLQGRPVPRGAQEGRNPDWTRRPVRLIAPLSGVRTWAPTSGDQTTPRRARITNLGGRPRRPVARPPRTVRATPVDRRPRRPVKPPARRTQTVDTNTPRRTRITSPDDRPRRPVARPTARRTHTSTDVEYSGQIRPRRPWNERPVRLIAPITGPGTVWRFNYPGLGGPNR